MMSKLLILMTCPHAFFATFKTSFIGRLLYLRDSGELAVRTSADIKVGKDRIFEKYLNIGYPRTFIYSVPNAFDDISTH